MLRIALPTNCRSGTGSETVTSKPDSSGGGPNPTSVTGKRSCYGPPAGEVADFVPSFAIGGREGRAGEGPPNTGFGKDHAKEEAKANRSTASFLESSRNPIRTEIPPRSEPGASDHRAEFPKGVCRQRDDPCATHLRSWEKAVRPEAEAVRIDCLQKAPGDSASKIDSLVKNPTSLRMSGLSYNI